MGTTRGAILSMMFGRTAIALMCAVALTFGLVAHSQARGAKAMLPLHPVVLLAGPAQSAPAAAPAAAICPYAAFVAGALSPEDAPACPRGAIRAVAYAVFEEIAPSPCHSGTLFRPPRTV